MKNFKYLFSGILIATIFGCTKDNNDLIFLDGVTKPTNISALVTIANDNSGKVTVQPNGEGVTSYTIQYGDSGNTSDKVFPGGKAQHTYTEGVYNMKIIATTVNGVQTEYIQPVTVSFIAPTDLLVTATTEPGRKLNVSATANYETYFDVYFGDVPNEVPQQFNEGQTISHTYATVGSYSLKVVARSGGVASTQNIQNVVITNLFAAPTPTVPASSVISMFSDAYTNVAVDTWRTSWSQANLQDISISGNATKKYSNLNFVGIEATTTPINATSMTHFHTDVWSSDFTAFKIKLVDFGANGSFGGGDDVEHEITFNSPAKETWVSLDIPLSSFVGLTTRAHIAQLIYVGAPAGNTTVYIDNVYFYNQAAILTTAAPTPTLPAANVISMFSNAYTNVTVDTWRTSWSQATLQDVSIAGNATKKYSGLDFVGIEATTTPINATTMTHFHTDVWSSDFTTFKVKLVDFGANGSFGGGDDVEHEITITSPAKGTWVSLDMPLSNFVGLTTRAHIAQLIYVGAPSGNNTVYVDNVYFHN
jgi:hypothetical protein